MPKKTKDLTPAHKLLRQTREAFERGDLSWSQGDALDADEGKCCVITGMMFAANGMKAPKKLPSQSTADRLTTATRLFAAANNIPKNAHGVYCSSVYAWNDDPARKFHDVLDAFERAESFPLY